MKKIMIVEDDYTCSQVLHHLLKELGYISFVCPNGLYAWEALKYNRDVELILTDIVMPIMDGRQLIEQIRADSKLYNMPIIAVSGAIGPKQIQLVMELGADYFLGKPITKKQLSEHIEKLLKDAASGRKRHEPPACLKTN